VRKRGFCCCVDGGTGRRVGGVYVAGAGGIYGLRIAIGHNLLGQKILSVGGVQVSLEVQ
jgi:hypothetical protein